MASYVDLVGDYIPIVSGAAIRDGDLTTLTSEESQLFDTTWEHVTRGINRYAAAPIINSKHYDLAKRVCEIVKKKWKDMPFSGDGSNGFGMRAIIPEDVFGNVNDHTWEYGNALVATNWTVGAAATRYSRNDQGFTQRDVGTFFAGASAVTRDGNNDEWYVLYWGMMDQSASGLPKGFWVALNNRERAFKDFDYQMANTEMAYNELGYGVLYEPTVPFKSGLQFKEVDAIAGARVAQVVAMRPIGVSFCTQRRALTQGLITRPTQA